jgi:hypothetical protein
MTTKRPNIVRPADAQFLKALVFGPHGNGKTRFLGTADDDERTKPMLFLDMEGGTQTLVGRDTDMVQVRDWADFNEAYAFLASGTSGYKSVAIDSISEVQIEGMLAILEKDTKRPDEDAMGQSEWGIILVQMRRFVRSFKDLPMHVFMTALAKDSVTPRVGAVKIPLLQGSFSNELPGIMDVIGYLALEDLENGGTQRTLLLHSFPKFSVKCRTPWGANVPAEIPDPTVGKLLDALGYKTRKAKA